MSIYKRIILTISPQDRAKHSVCPFKETSKYDRQNFEVQSPVQDSSFDLQIPWDKMLRVVLVALFIFKFLR